MVKNNIVVDIENLSKKYKIYSKPHHRLFEWITLGKLKKHTEFWALSDVSLSVSQGECIGIIGHNGAGKSTLLKILSKALYPTHGSMKVKGNMVSLLELGTGFNPELTGLQNIFTSGKLLGFSEEYLNNKLTSILDFSELGDFIHQPVKSYSSGMYVRLAFSLYASLEPDIYVVDEALSVGDIFFQQKCFDFLQQLKANGAAIILVTHDMQSVKKYCDRVFILNNGKVTNEGNPLEMVNIFYSSSKHKLLDRKLNGEQIDLNTLKISNIDIPEESKQNIRNAVGIRRGDGKVKIIGAIICDLDGKEVKTAYTGDNIILNIFAEIEEDVADLAFTYQMADRHNTVVFGQSSYMLTKNILSASKGNIIRASFNIEMNLFQGLYTVMVGATDCQTEVSNMIYDLIEGCMTLEIMKPSWRSFHGVALMNSSFEIEGLTNISEATPNEKRQNNE
ncbi:ABC transporter ATP-binding protein [Paenibacillus marchantiophytorum]|uniref:ABC transporter ATP-binding protein n=2 Tax=Paenibacillus marchantiophytorum TaxID=1619310 RepID=A0ABQ2BS22_9BACL|nr:ABC transporter ATP-binding protein [Paenibacillus marchantiophytorum]